MHLTDIYYYPNEDYRHDFNRKNSIRPRKTLKTSEVIEEETKLVLKDDKILISYGSSQIMMRTNEDTGLVSSNISMDILQKIIEGNYLSKVHTTT